MPNKQDQQRKLGNESRSQELAQIRSRTIRQVGHTGGKSLLNRPQQDWIKLSTNFYLVPSAWFKAVDYELFAKQLAAASVFTGLPERRNARKYTTAVLSDCSTALRHDCSKSIPMILIF
jgi:hypothetical protein